MNLEMLISNPIHTPTQKLAVIEIMVLKFFIGAVFI